MLAGLVWKKWRLSFFMPVVPLLAFDLAGKGTLAKPRSKGKEGQFRRFLRRTEKSEKKRKKILTFRLFFGNMFSMQEGMSLTC
jgi:hypothetical protein